MKLTKFRALFATLVAVITSGTANACPQNPVTFNPLLNRDLVIELMEKNSLPRTEAETYIHTLTIKQKIALLGAIKKNKIIPSTATGMFTQ